MRYMWYGLMGFNLSYLLCVIPALIFALWAQARVSRAFKKNSKLINHHGYTGADVARRILDLNNLHNVQIDAVAGELTDNYDPKTKTVHLSQEVYNAKSVAALGVAAHEVGHAIQHAEGYSPIMLRNAVFPVVRISSYAAWPLAIIGFLIGWLDLIYIGIILFSAVVAFQLITLPVEFNASRRAIYTLENQAILYGDELAGAKQVLNAAALTYVAAAAVAIGNLLRLLLMTNRR